MEPDFWHQRWQKNQIGFHEDVVNPTLVKHFPKLNQAAGISSVESAHTESSL